MPEIKQFARIRASQCWERRGKTIHIKGKAIGIAPDYNSTLTRPIVNFMEFDDVLEEKSTNRDVFDKVLKPMCDHAVATENTSNSIFICHGYSATGKTHTILGSEGVERGVLQLSATHLLKHANSKNVELQVIESYGKSKQKVSAFDVLRGQKIESDALDHLDANDVSSFFMWCGKNSGIRRITRTIRSNLHIGCTARNNQSSRGHVAYILSIRKADGEKTRIILLDLGAPKPLTLPFNKQFSSKCDPRTLKKWKHEAKTLDRGLLGIQKQIRAFATEEELRENKSDPLRTLLYPFLVDESKSRSLLMSILFTFSPSITCIEESRSTLRAVYTMTGCKILSEHCSWKKEHLQDPTLRFKNAAQTVQLKVNALGQMLAARGQMDLKRDSKELQVIKDVVRQSFDLQIPDVDVPNIPIESEEVPQNQKQSINITDLHGRRRTNAEKSITLYYEELQFAEQATKVTLGDALLSNEERKSMDQTQQIIQKEMSKIQSVARNSSIILPTKVHVEALRDEILDDKECYSNQQSVDMNNTVTKMESQDSFTDTFEFESYFEVDGEYLKSEKERLEKYETTLSNTLDVLQDLPNHDECFPGEITRINDELKRINQETIAIKKQIEAFDAHCDEIANAISKQQEYSEELKVDNQSNQVTDSVNSSVDQEVEELDGFDADQLLWETLYFVLAFTPCFLSL